MTELSTMMRNLSSELLSTSAPPSSSPTHPAIGIALLVVALVMGLPGNLFVAWTILFRLRHRSVTCLLVLQLAVADTLVLLTAPFFLHQLALGGIWEFGDGLCRLLHYGCGVNMYASVYLIALMASDRLLGVVRPFLSQRVRTKSRLWPATSGVWTLALALSIPVLVYRHLETESQRCMSHYPSQAHQVGHYCLETAAAFALPFSLLALCYCSIARSLQASKFRWRQQSRRRTSRLILLIVGSFILLWAPYHLVNVLQVGALLAGSSGSYLLTLCQTVRPAVIALAFLSSSINPLLYACAGSAFAHSSGLHCVTRLLEGTFSESRGGQDGSVKMGEVSGKEKNADRD